MLVCMLLQYNVDEILNLTVRYNNFDILCIAVLAKPVSNKSTHTCIDTNSILQIYKHKNTGSV